MSEMDPVPSPVRLSAVAAPGQPEPTPALEQLYRGFEQEMLVPLWTQIGDLMPAHPSSKAAAHLWRWDHLLKLADEAGRIVPVGRGGERRAIALANPALGVASDLIVQHGGTSVLSETPEIYGAEHLLTRRAVSPEVAQKLLSRIDWWRDYTARNGDELNNNPSYGNKQGGLTTILEKSLGAVAKGGTMPLKAVYEYAEPVTEKGFVFMDTPGYDPVSVTGMVAGGANIVCFTTGRGSVFGCKPVPSIKLSTNSDTYHRMTDDMDINCGEILDGVATVDEMGDRIFERMLEVASGQLTKSEEIGLGDEEFTPWQLGAVM